MVAFIFAIKRLRIRYDIFKNQKIYDYFNPDKMKKAVTWFRYFCKLWEERFRLLDNVLNDL